MIKFQTNLFGFAQNRLSVVDSLSLCITFFVGRIRFEHFRLVFAADWFDLQIDSGIQFRRVLSGRVSENKSRTEIFPLNSYSAFQIENVNRGKRESIEREKWINTIRSVFFLLVKSIIQFEISCLFNKNECFPIRFSPEKRSKNELRDKRMTEKFTEKGFCLILRKDLFVFSSAIFPFFSGTRLDHNNFMKWEGARGFVCDVSLKYWIFICVLRRFSSKKGLNNGK
jgi:hypothetical protein